MAPVKELNTQSPALRWCSEETHQTSPRGQRKVVVRENRDHRIEYMVITCVVPNCPGWAGQSDLLLKNTIKWQ